MNTEFNNFALTDFKRRQCKLDYYSTKEIAEQLNLSVSTIETHLQLGLRFMREELRKRYGIVVSVMLPVSILFSKLFI